MARPSLIGSVRNAATASLTGDQAQKSLPLIWEELQPIFAVKHKWQERETHEN